MTQARRGGSDQAGFALIELIIALALLAIAVALMPSALRLGAHAWHARGALERVAETSLALAALERRIGEATPIYERGDGGGLRLAFLGAPDTMSFIAPSVNGPAGSGLYRHRLEVGRAGGLALGLSLYAPGDGDASTAEVRTLVAPPASVGLRYFGSLAVGAPPQWHDDWQREDAFPALVEIAIRPTASADAPVRRIVVAPRLDARR